MRASPHLVHDARWERHRHVRLGPALIVRDHAHQVVGSLLADDEIHLSVSVEEAVGTLAIRLGREDDRERGRIERLRDRRLQVGAREGIRQEDGVAGPLERLLEHECLGVRLAEAERDEDVEWCAR